jgi:HEPN domain-containing protein
MNEEKEKRLIEYWTLGSEDEWDYMETLFKADKYVPALFFLHLSIEKTLKAYYVKIFHNYAPITHNLLLLAKNLNLKLSDEFENFLIDLYPYNIITRYPDDQKNLKKVCTKSLTSSFILKGKEFKKWLLSRMK